MCDMGKILMFEHGFDGGDKRALLELDVFGGLFEELFGEFVDLFVVLLFDRLAKRLYSLLASLHNYNQPYIHVKI